jgi:hypothetical protein
LEENFRYWQHEWSLATLLEENRSSDQLN